MYSDAQGRQEQSHLPASRNLEQAGDLAVFDIDIDAAIGRI